MLDFILYYFQYLAIALIAIIAVVKVVLFFRYKGKNSPYHNIIFYPYQSIIMTTGAKRRGIKRIQNMLTYIILVLVFLYLIIRFLIL